MNEICANCKYFFRFDKPKEDWKYTYIGECRCWPDDHNPRIRFPGIEDDQMWCGRFTGLEEEPTDTEIEWMIK